MTGGLVDLGDLDVWQPERAAGGALDDAAAEAATQLHREIGAACRIDLLGAPAAELRVESAGLRQVTGVQLQMDNRMGSDGFIASS